MDRHITWWQRKPATPGKSPRLPAGCPLRPVRVPGGSWVCRGSPEPDSASGAPRGPAGFKLTSASVGLTFTECRGVSGALKVPAVHHDLTSPSRPGPLMPPHEPFPDPPVSRGPRGHLHRSTLSPDPAAFVSGLALPPAAEPWRPEGLSAAFCWPPTPGPPGRHCGRY